MANVKFTEFPSATTVGSTDIIPIVQSGANKKATVAVFSTYIGSAFVALTGNQTVAGVKTFSSQLASSVATGTAPFSIASTTKVTNLNADLLDGYTSGDFQLALTNPITGTGTTNYLPKFTGSTALGNSSVFDNGTSVGIGTATPNASYKLDINGGVHISSGNFYRYATDVGIIGSGTSITGGLATQLAIRSSSDILFSTGGATERMRINSVGNLGLGITPSTATGRFIQFGAGAALSTNNTNNSNFWHNTTFDASGNTLYAVTGQQSSYYRQINGQHVWAYAAAGTAGNAITFTNNMVLDGTGQLSTLGDATINGVKVGRGAGNISTNTAVGFEAINSNVSGTDVTAIGYRALKASTGVSNTAVGSNALTANTTGVNNTAIGKSALIATTTGFSNTGIGESVLLANVGGTYNTAIGSAALSSNVSGSNNIAIGRLALQLNTASNNTAVGFEAGKTNTSGANNIFIGYQATGISITESNRTWIGNSSTTSTWLAGNTLIGTTTDAGYKLDVNGTARVNSTFLVNTGTANQNTKIFGNKVGMSRTSDGAEVVYFSKNTDLGAEGTANINGYDGIQFRTQGAESVKAVITSAGNFGIGTTSPVAISNYTTLDLRGTNGSLLYMGQAGATASLRLIGEGTNSYIDNINTIGDILFRTNNATERMRITLGGNVLIGTTTDSGHKLNVNGVIKNNDDIITTNGTISTILAYSTTYGGVFGTSSNHNANIYTNGTPKLTITTTGNVGIGITSPTTKLDVFDYKSFLTLSSNINSEATTDNEAIGGIVFKKHYAAAIGASIKMLQAAGTNGYSQAHLAFYTNDASISWSDPVERMKIMYTGEIGIGTSAPDASAKVQIDSNTQGFLVPRMLESEINSISSPAAGLMVYNTDQNHMCMFDGSVWKKLSMSNM